MQSENVIKHEILLSMQLYSVLSIPRHPREVRLKAHVLALLGHKSLSQQTYFREKMLPVSK